ncbi:phage holin family protein [Tundrisphaera sp. TA3]|uniref:phage holin family protein n=1 Tax=Tundrisphaera sp. TA3 TaxID=3435775 RepID=UPI003EBFE2B1
MANQASMNRTASLANGAAPEGVVESIAEFVNDVTTLADLQTRLAIYDTKEAIGRATYPAIFVAVGASFALASLPLLLFGLSDLLATGANLHPGVARLIVGFLSLAIAGALAFFSFKAATRSLDSYRRSQEELTRNIAWLRTVIVHSGRPGPRRNV